MPDYRMRTATLADTDTLVRHRLAMFTEMGTTFDAPLIDGLFRAWLREMMPAGEYRAWLCEAEGGEIAAGVGLTLLKWPPGPSALRTERIAFVYNVYTELPHRKRGLARLLMETVHAWCTEHGVGALALNAAPAAQHLYRTLGYIDAPSPMMWKVFESSVIGS
jgi:GNAT superfamily N-acetyltransferase